MPEKPYYMYIMASKSGVLYIDFTNNLVMRVWQHKTHLNSGFTDKYECERLVYAEAFDTASEGMGREKQLKGWTRKRKIALIESKNPGWKDHAGAWFDATEIEKAKEVNRDSRS